MSPLVVSILILLFGAALLYAGTLLLVEACLQFSKRFAVSHAFSGIVLMSMATSAPEVVVSLEAHLHHHTLLALNNIIGSNIANLLLVFGLILLLAPKGPKIQGRLNFFVLMASVLLVFLAAYGGMPRLLGFGFLLSYGGYLFLAYRENKRQDTRRSLKINQSGTKVLLFALTGAATLYFGSRFIVQSALEIADLLGISQGVVGLTIVAIGTSLPEILTILVARKHTDATFLMGNLIGSNIFNTLAILGLMAALAPFPAQGSQDQASLILLGISTLVLLPLGCLKSQAGCRRALGLGFLGLYGVYIYSLY